MHLRVLAALLSFSATKPLELSDRFVPKQDAKRAAKELAKLRRRDPAAVAFVHQSPWHVPIRWFVLFDDGERWLGEDEFGRTRLRYRTTARRAMRRAERAVPVLRRTDLGPISELILDLHQWLAGFDPASLLELDYATLCDFMTWDELDDDRSSRDLHEALDALEREEFPRSADIYQGVLTHWAESAAARSELAGGIAARSGTTEGVRMKIGVLGTGVVGRTIGTRLVGLGHEVIMGSRTADNAHAAEWVAEAGAGASHGTFADAGAGADLFFNCTLGTASIDALGAVGAGPAGGKVVVDVSNPLDFSRGMPPSLWVCNTDSLGEQIQRAFPDALVVKTLNTMNCEVMVDPSRVPGDHDVFVSGDDDGAKAQVKQLLGSFGWSDDRIIDLGDITTSRGPEMYLPLWLELYGVLLHRDVEHQGRAIAVAGCRSSGQGQNRTADTAVFSRVLCQLSYLARAVETWQKPPPRSPPMR